MVKQDNDEAKVGDAATMGTADNDVREMDSIEIHYDDEDDTFSGDPLTGETAWLEREQG